MFAAFTCTCLFVQPADARVADARAAFEKLATEMKSFQTREFLDATEPWRLPKSWAANLDKGLAALRAERWDVKPVTALLKHENPKVRVLALAALFDRQDPSLVPHFIPLLDDKARHFPVFEVRRAIAQFPSPKEDSTEPDPQDVHHPSVGDFATSCLRFWMEHAGYDRIDAKNAREYVANSERHGFRSSWWAAKLQRVTSRTSASPEYYKVRKPLYVAFRKELDALEPKRRDWVLFWIVSRDPWHGSVTGGDVTIGYLGGMEAVLAAGKRIGPDRMRALLRGETIPGDADLGNDERCLRVRRATVLYILRHAVAWLTPEDAEELKGRYDKAPGDVDWILAAAALRPAAAEAWLKKAIADHDTKRESDSIRESWLRARLAAGLARILGESEGDYLADWYFAEHVPMDRLTYTPSRQIFTLELDEQPFPAAAKVLARLIRDPRFAKATPPPLLLSMACCVNRHAKREVVAWKDLSPSFSVDNPHDRMRLEGIQQALAVWAKEVLR